MTLNLKKPEGLAVFKQLVATADVVVENWRPDVKTRLGVDYDALRAINPRIILASISGFGQDGPYADRPGFDQIIQGMGGLMSVTGFAGGGPLRAGLAVADCGTGIYAAVGVLLALLEREHSGVGQWVHSSLLHTQIALMDFQAARYLNEGDTPVQAGNDHPTSSRWDCSRPATAHSIWARPAKATGAACASAWTRRNGWRIHAMRPRSCAWRTGPRSMHPWRSALASRASRIGSAC